MMDYKTLVNPYKFLGQPRTAQNVVPTWGFVSPDTKKSLGLKAWRLQNTSGSAGALALVGLLPDNVWEAGQWAHNAGAPIYTADTVDAQDVDTDDFPLHTVANDNDGHLIGANFKFGAVSYDITTASIGAGQVHELAYWNGAWTVLTALQVLVDIPRTAGQVWAAGEVLLLFVPPADWIVGGSGTNVNQNRYNLRVRATTKPTTAALAARLYIGEVIYSEDGVAVNGVSSLVLSPDYLPLPSRFQAIGGVFATADAGNSLFLLYTLKH